MLEQINPTVKMAVLIVVAVLLGVTHSTLANMVIVVPALGWILLRSQTTAWRLMIFMIPVLWVAFGMYLTGVFYGDATNIYSPEGAGMVLATRVLAFGAMGGLFALTTEPVAFVRSLQQQARLPQKYAFGVFAAVNMMPRTAEQYAECRRAMVVRGVQVHPFAIIPIRNMLVNTVRWSEYLSVAMTSRGFDPHAPRTTRHRIPLGARDLMFGVVWGLLLLSMLLGDHLVR